MAKILGIDLGTTNSAMAVISAGDPEIIDNAEGNRTTPSMTAYSKSGERLVGLLAKRQAITNPSNTIFSVKRFIGRKFNDKEVQKEKKLAPYEMREAKNQGIEVKMGDEWYTPEAISSMILSKLRADAEKRLGESVTDAVITVPAYFDDSQRQATKNAGEIAGLNVRRILNEPTAAALAYGLNKNDSHKIVVYDFGGGTFDVSVLEVGDNTVEVLATGGDTYLGGDDLDQKIIEYLVEEYKKQEGIDIKKDPLALQRLKEAVERAKHELSSAMETEVNLPYISSSSDGPKHFLIKLSRAKFESLVNDLIDRSIVIVEEVVTGGAGKGAGLKLSDIDEVVLVGGQTRMPLIHDSVKKLFGKEPHTGINPDEVVAVGAAIQGEILVAKDEGREPSGNVQDILLLDVTPLSLSIETLGGVATPMISKNTTVPTEKKQVFSTAADNQTSVEVHVLQGERPMASDNKTLARFILDGIPPAPRGVPQVEVTFDIDANGILNVTAMDKASGKKQTVKVEATSALAPEEIEKLKKDAEIHASDDEKKRELIEVKNMAESILYTTEKSLKDQAGKIDESLKKEIEEKIESLKKVKDENDIESIKKNSEELSTAIQKIGNSMYNKGDDTSENGSSSTAESK
ncbi:MAG: molecular chaperone DnaK [Candidatus Liptonbacteria bacterium CG11_big_fil_rev_8_21_14_0_20_35_14]|uniref:Chaperone protein DnaK n=1 Tax=Candidatus Liptonbacteria bacterium CG11_big_fil_rev_8_21_14_0_20_35_14 TaxID=1974634 RepID=A0A2H0N8P0_9BACT|nr:MAG: molecular chaperone DnaK [Candidatus Liptonbacteria bacterium CG11_big_fil_rev_8_21_14_0_20_35_14]